MKRKKKLTISEILKKARKLVEKGWTQGAYAKDGNGRILFFDDKKAVKFCPLGAIGRVTGSLYNAEAVGARYAVIDSIEGGMLGFDIASWNDDKKRTKRQVLAAFDRAIKAVK